MGPLKTIGAKVYKLYMALGMLSIAILAICVIYAVIARYCFNISYR